MNQTYSRNAKLPAFKCDIASLDSLIAKLRRHFPGGVSIDVVVNETRRRLSFDSVDELAKTPDLPAEVGTWSFRISSYDEGNFYELAVYCGLGGIRRAEVNVTGPTAEWCAGLIEGVTTFTARYRMWQSYVPWTGVAAVVLLAVGSVTSVFGSPTRELYNRSTTIAIAAGVTLGVVATVAGSRMRPYPTLVIRREDSFWKRNHAEIGTIAAIVAALAAVVAAAATWLSR